MRIISANLNGIRSASTKGFFDWLPAQQADVVCVQELKAQAADLKPEFIQCDGLSGHFHHAEKKGYSGVGVYTRKPPQAIIEGRLNPDGKFQADTLLLKCPTRYEEQFPEQAQSN